MSQSQESQGHKTIKRWSRNLNPDPSDHEIALSNLGRTPRGPGSGEARPAAFGEVSLKRGSPGGRRRGAPGRGAALGGRRPWRPARSVSESLLGSAQGCGVMTRLFPVVSLGAAAVPSGTTSWDETRPRSHGRFLRPSPGRVFRRSGSAPLFSTIASWVS